MLWTDITAQSPQLYFEKITVENGLSHNSVNCITQDSRGFIWIGTDDGLNRFNGRDFKIFRHEPGNPSSVSGNRITDLLEDEEGILWIATIDGGLTRYDHRLPPDQQFKQYKHLPGDTTAIPGNSLTALWLDRHNKLWIATRGSYVLRFDKQTEEFSSPVTTGTHTALALCGDKNDTLWVGRQGMGILKISPATLQYESDPRYDDLYADLPHVEVSSLYCDAQGDIWFGSWDQHLYRYNSRTYTEETFPENTGKGSFVQDEILCFAEDREGHLWLGGASKGLQLYDREKQCFYLFRHDPFREGTVAGNSINCLFLDKDGTMWVGTDKGISISNPLLQQFQQTFLPAVHRRADPKNGEAASQPSVIYCLYEDEDETLWLGTNNGLFFRKAGARTFTHRPLYYRGQQLAVSCFFKEGEQLYLGTNYSLFRYDIPGNTLKILPNTEQDQVMNGLIESRITSIVKDTIEGRPVLLVTPYGHWLAYYDLQLERWVSRRDSTKNIIENFGLKDNLIRKFYKTSTGKIWLANTNGGLGEWAPAEDAVPKVLYHIHNPLQERGLQNNYVYDVKEGKDGRLWISTFGGGLHYMDTRTGEIRYVEGSPNLLEGIQVDEAGNVYMISNGNLSWYNPERQLFSSVKLPDREKTGGVSGSVFKDASGQLYVGGKDYFISFDPRAIQQERPVRRVLFTDFRIFNDSYSHLLNSEHIRLPYRQNSISFSFTSPDFSFSTPLRYAYQLEGVDKDWVQSGRRNTANYTNLLGGDYVFRVKVAESPERRDEPVTELFITIVPPFWSRGWFYALCAATVALIIYIIYRYRINELLKRQAIRNRIAQDLHDNMGSALSSISVYSEVAQVHNRRREQTALQEVLKKISSTSSGVISEMSDTVWAINPRNDSMQKILQRMESFARPLASARQIALHIDYDQALPGANLDMEKRKNFYLIFKEAFTNAVKYAEPQNIAVSIRLEKHAVIMEVQDDGKGFDVQQHLQDNVHSLSGNGLKNMMTRAQEMKGSCEIHSVAGKGTTVVLRFGL